MRGTCGSCPDRALVLYMAGYGLQAHAAIQRSIDLQPSYEPAWQFLHYLNVRVVAHNKPEGRFPPFIPTQLSTTTPFLRSPSVTEIAFSHISKTYDPGLFKKKVRAVGKFNLWN